MRPSTGSAAKLRAALVKIALQWQECFGVAPAVTNAISELDAATLVGMSIKAYSSDCVGKSAVRRVHDFKHRDKLYQVKANRPSGLPGSRARKVSKANNYDWDRLIWILYDREYNLQEAWEWTVADYRRRLRSVKYVRPEHMRKGHPLKPSKKSGLWRSRG